MMVDSLYMTEEDREKITQKCLEAKEDHIVITHGTDTMVQTAKVLNEKVKNKMPYRLLKYFLMEYILQ
jgi:L-asparaginase